MAAKMLHFRPSGDLTHNHPTHANVTPQNSALSFVGTRMLNKARYLVLSLSPPISGEKV